MSRFNMSVYEFDDVENVSYYDYMMYQADEIPSIPMEEMVAPLLVYSITYILGLVGNILILVAVTGQKQVRQSPTNVFLASLATADLLLIFICLPLKIGKLFSFSWEFGWIICKLTHYSETLSVICSVLNLTALSVERYYAVVHPMKAQYLCTTSQAKKVTILVWLMALFLAIPTAIVRIHLPVGDGSVYWCILDWDRPWIWQLHELYLLITILIVPGTMMVISYSSIICQLSKINIERRNLASYKCSITVTETVRDNQEMDNTTVVTNNTYDTIPAKPAEDKPIDEIVVPQGVNVDKRTPWSIYFKSKKFRSYSFKENSTTTHHRTRRLSDFIGLQNINEEVEIVQESRSQKLGHINVKVTQREKETKQVIYMLILIMLLFFTCWAPILIFNVLASFDMLGEGNTGTATNTKHIKTAFSLLSYSNSCLNPLIYGFMSKHFRRSFSSTMCLRQNVPATLAVPTAENMT